MTPTPHTAAQRPHVHPSYPHAAHPALRGAPLKVVVVDDDEALLALYEHHIKHWPLPVELRTFSDGYQALEHVASHPAELLIVDWQMPLMSGSELISSMKQAPGVPAATTVVVSASDLASIRRDAAVNAAMQVLPKPVPFARLLAIAQTAANERPL
jgi:CheY-like chemotaxis protein